MIKSACFSLDRIYRYSLKRIWIEAKPFVLFVCLNPSTADENVDDPTIRRCIKYAADWGYGGMVMVNLYGYRSTDQSKLYKVRDPIGPHNDIHIRRNNQLSGITVVAWGVAGNKNKNHRAEKVFSMIKNPHYLELTKDGFPKHPLYLKKDLKPKPYYI